MREAYSEAERWIDGLRDRHPWLNLPAWACLRLLDGCVPTIRTGAGKGLTFSAPRGPAGYLLGTAAKNEQDAIVRYLQKGDVFYDVGAHIGFLSIIAARRVGPHGHVYAFEPVGGSFQLAERNVLANGFSCVTCERLALSDRAGWVDMQPASDTTRFRIPGQPAGARISQRSTGAHISAQPTGALHAPCTTLDVYVEETGARAPTLVKVDVEGHEMAVLRGMRDVLMTYRPAVLVEVHRHGTRFTEFCDAFLKTLEYTARRLDGTPLPSREIRYHALLTPRDGA